jgi:hypothetical protein
MNPFRALDDHVVPRLGRGLARCLDALTGGRDGNLGRRVLVRAAALLLVVAVGGTLYAGRSRPPAADPTTGDVVRVGVASGDQVPAYLARSRDELIDLSTRGTEETYALVALHAYTEPQLLGPLLQGVRTELVYARVPLPNVQTEIVSIPVNALPGDVEAAFRRVGARKQAEAADAEWSAGKLAGDDPRERELRALYLDIARVDRAESSAYRGLCACAYGVVVRATPLRLRQLAARPGVRAVDAAPEVRRLDRTVFSPLRPELTAVVGPPADSGPTAVPSR